MKRIAFKFPYFSILILFVFVCLLGSEAKDSRLLLITSAKNMEILKKTVVTMENNGYFQNISYTYELSLPENYHEAQEDKKMLIEEIRFSDASFARTFPSGTPRILFFDSYFKINLDKKIIFLLHEIAHQISYDSGINDELYKRASIIKNIRIYTTDTRMKSIFERIANKQMSYILSLSDEMHAEKWLYKKYPDLFDKRISSYYEDHLLSLRQLKEGILQGKDGKLILQLTINRILFIKSIFLFYKNEKKTEHFNLVLEYEDCIKLIVEKIGVDWKFIFDYIERFLKEYKKKELNSQELIGLFLSYRKDFLQNIFNYKE